MTEIETLRTALQDALDLMEHYDYRALVGNEIADEMDKTYVRLVALAKKPAAEVFADPSVGGTITVAPEQLVNDPLYKTWTPTSADGDIVGHELASRLPSPSKASNETWFTMRVQALSREWAAGNLSLGEFENSVVMAARDWTLEHTGSASLEQPTIMLGSTTIVDQPPPVASKHRPSWELVINAFEQLNNDPATRALVLVDMRERDKIGRERYGLPLQAGNGRRHLIDAYQEFLDAVVYMMTWLEEEGVDLERANPSMGDGTALAFAKQKIGNLFYNVLGGVVTIRELIEEEF